MPVDSEADMRPPAKSGGNLVLTLRGGSTGELVCERFDPLKHDEKRNRYTSHFATCPNADDHRRSK